MIRKVNNNQVIFNLFGDVKQHIETEKGINNWNELSSVIEYNEYQLNENYRNARQITDFCNHRFRMNMTAINLDGDGVHLIANSSQFKEEIERLLMQARKPGLSAIIVDSRESAKKIQRIFSRFPNKFHDLTDGQYDIHQTRWNIILIEDVKGLEFSNVIAVTGLMSENEKYITYTRALNELWVYEDELTDENKIPIKKPESSNLRTGITSRKRRARPSEIREKSSDSVQPSEVQMPKQDVKSFLKEHGLTVIDKRNSGGCLWALGNEESIGDIIQQAVEKYNIVGAYSASSATRYRIGWYTKTKK